MERAHLRRLKQRFGRHLRDVRVVCLDIPDDYGYMDPELVALLLRKVPPLLPKGAHARSPTSPVRD